MDATIRFYETILGFPRVAENLTRVIEGGTLRQVNFDLGDGQYIVFMEPNGIRGISEAYDTGINRALGLPAGMYHFAFKVSSLDDLQAWREKLLSHGVDASAIIDLGTAKSVFLSDPNNIQIELCCHVRPFNETDLHQESEASMALPDQ